MYKSNWSTSIIIALATHVLLKYLYFYFFHSQIYASKCCRFILILYDTIMKSDCKTGMCCVAYSHYLLGFKGLKGLLANSHFHTPACRKSNKFFIKPL